MITLLCVEDLIQEIDDYSRGYPSLIAQNLYDALSDASRQLLSDLQRSLRSTGIFQEREAVSSIAYLLGSLEELSEAEKVRTKSTRETLLGRFDCSRTRVIEALVRAEERRSQLSTFCPAHKFNE